MPTLDQRIAAIEARRKTARRADALVAMERISSSEAAAVYAEFIAPLGGEPPPARDAFETQQSYIAMLDG